MKQLFIAFLLLCSPVFGEDKYFDIHPTAQTSLIDKDGKIYRLEVNAHSFVEVNKKFHIINTYIYLYAKDVNLNDVGFILPAINQQFEKLPNEKPSQFRILKHEMAIPNEYLEKGWYRIEFMRNGLLSSCINMDYFDEDHYWSSTGLPIWGVVKNEN